MIDWFALPTGWFPLLVLSAVAGPVFIALGNLLLRYATWGNPRDLLRLGRLMFILNSVPPTTVFRWRTGAGLQVVVYDEEADEEKEMPSGIWPDREGPGLIFWMWGDQPRSAAFVAQRVSRDIAVRVLCFFLSFLGAFVVLVRLAITESPLWLVALVFLAVHQIAVAATGRYIQWPVLSWGSAVMAICIFLYLQGGTFETIAVFAAGAHFVLATLLTWYVMTSSYVRKLRQRATHLGLREQRMGDHHL